jgi:hypothetical protein
LLTTPPIRGRLKGGKDRKGGNMANLDKLLKKIEQNKDTENDVKTYPLEIAGEKFEVKTMTRKEKRDFVYAQEAGGAHLTAGDIVKKMKPFIYKSLDLAQLATKAKDAGFIKSYYDVVEALFEPDEIMEIISFITTINGLANETMDEEISDIKK